MAIRDLKNKESSPSPIYEGIIVGNPGSVNNEIEVTIPAFDPDLKWGPMPWPPRVNDAGLTVYPQSGDRCVVVLAETDVPGTPEPWCVMWWH